MIFVHMHQHHVVANKQLNIFINMVCLMVWFSHSTNNCIFIDANRANLNYSIYSGTLYWKKSLTHSLIMHAVESVKQQLIFCCDRCNDFSENRICSIHKISNIFFPWKLYSIQPPFCRKPFILSHNIFIWLAFRGFSLFEQARRIRNNLILYDHDF